MFGVLRLIVTDTKQRTLLWIFSSLNVMTSVKNLQIYRQISIFQIYFTDLYSLFKVGQHHNLGHILLPNHRPKVVQCVLFWTLIWHTKKKWYIWWWTVYVFRGVIWAFICVCVFVLSKEPLISKNRILYKNICYYRETP